MKYCLLLFCLLFITEMDAQSAPGIQNDSVKNDTKLSEADFLKAKKMYVEMTKTETYITLHKSLKAMRKKLNDLGLPPIGTEDIDENKYKESLKIWLSDNLSKTKFSSVDEGFAIITEYFDLNGKLIAENAELYYDLMKRADLEQIGEILEPERRGMYYSE